MRRGPLQEDTNIQRHVHLAGGLEPRRVTIQTRGRSTEGGQVVFEVIGEVVALPRGFIVELNVYDMVGVLVSRFDHADHVEGCG